MAAALADDDGRTAMNRFVTSTTTVLPITSALVAMTRDGEHRGAVATSDATAATFDELQFKVGEGPILDADRDGRPVLEPDLGSAIARWPAFAPAATDLGVHAAFAFPLLVGVVHLGVLGLLRDEPGALDPPDLADALSLAQLATHLLLELEADLTPGWLPERLEEIVEHRAVVHQATGMIATQLSVDVATALRRLRGHAWSNNRAIDDVANDVVARTLRFDGA